MEEELVAAEATQPWTDCRWARPFIQQLCELYNSSTLVGDKECPFESLVEPLRGILLPVAASADDPEFMQGAKKAQCLRDYLISIQNTTSRQSGAAIPDHGLLGSQQNRGPVMVCNPVFNNFSPGLL